MAEPSESLLATFLADRDQPCPQCEYNLRNLQGTRCPECGEELVLRVNMAEPRQRLLIAGLIGLSAGAGLNGLLLVYLAIRILIINRYVGNWDNRFLKVNAIGLLVEGTAILLWLLLWRRIRNRSLTLRISLMIACWFLSVANIVVFSFTIH